MTGKFTSGTGAVKKSGQYLLLDGKMAEDEKDGGMLIPRESPWPYLDEYMCLYEK